MGLTWEEAESQPLTDKDGVAVARAELRLMTLMLIVKVLNKLIRKGPKT